MIDEKDLPEDLKGDLIPEIDPAKLFDEKEYATIIIGSEGMSKKDKHSADDLTLLISRNSTREEKDEALRNLKEHNAQAFILSAIGKTKKPEHKALLVAACWETGLDFSKDFLYFIELIGHENFHVSFEALTVIQEMEATIDHDTLRQASDLLKRKSPADINVTEALKYLETLLNTAD